MSYDLFTEYPCRTENDVRRIVGDHKQAPYKEILDIYTRIKLLTPSVVEECKEYAKNGHFKYGGGYKSLVYSPSGQNVYTAALIEPALRTMQSMGLYPPVIDVNRLPYFSFFLQINITLATPCYIGSGSSESFYIHETQQFKDTVFKVPAIPGSSWKGNFREVARRLLQERQCSAEMYKRLFGEELEHEEKEELRGQGRLRFYVTFFDRIGLDLINPHDRKTKAGTVPILEEVIPPRASGVFSLLYVPYDLFTQIDRKRARTEVAEDLVLASKTIKDVFHTYGFSAKAARGFGLARYRYRKITNQKEEPGGFIEMSGVPVYRQEPKEKPTELSKDNRFSDYDGLNRIVDKIVKQLS